MKTVAATEFKAKCLRLIGEMSKDNEPVTITKHGRPVAVLSPLSSEHAPFLVVGALRGTVLSYNDPFLPATEPSDWNAAQ